MNHPPVRVLVVDDDPAILELYAGALACHDWIELTIASSAREALACVAERGADALVIDLRLPDGDGCKLLADIRQALGHAAPAILITADAGSEVKADAFRAGFDGIVRKPVNEAVLRRTLLALVDGQSRSVVSTSDD